MTSAASNWSVLAARIGPSSRSRVSTGAAAARDQRPAGQPVQRVAHRVRVECAVERPPDDVARGVTTSGPSAGEGESGDTPRAVLPAPTAMTQAASAARPIIIGQSGESLCLAVAQR